jgi:hypothetical protein
MEALGFRAVDFRDLQLSRGDRMVVPLNNTNVDPGVAKRFRLRGFHEAPVCGWLSTLNTGVGAGFYSHTMGPIPYVFGAIPPDRYAMLDLY